MEMENGSTGNRTRQNIANALGALWDCVPVLVQAGIVLSMAQMATALFNPSRPAYMAFAPACFILYFLSLWGRLGQRFGKAKAALAAALLVSAFVALSADALLWSGSEASREIVIGADEASSFNGGIPVSDGDLVEVDGSVEYRIDGKVAVWVQAKNSIARSLQSANILVFALLLVHCVSVRGAAGLYRFFVVCLAYGFLLESGGIVLDFFHEVDYPAYIPLFAAPVATMLGWTIVFYTTSEVFEGLALRFPRLARSGATVHGISIALIAVCLDLCIDPVATNIGLWTWNSILEPFVFGVPLVNFTSWFAALFAYAFLSKAIEEPGKHGFSELSGSSGLSMQPGVQSPKRKRIPQLALVPASLLLAAIVNFGILALAEGLSGPSWQVLRGAFARFFAAL